MQQIITDKVLLALLGLCFGLVFGSFATALIYRLPRNIDWVFKRSHCTICQHTLGVIDLIPVFYFVFSGGKCRFCKSRFGCKYLFIELLVAASFIFGLCHYGLNIYGITFSLLAFAIIVMSVIDFEHYIIPDEVNFFIGLLGAIYSGYNAISLTEILYMPIFCFLFAFLLRGIMYLWKRREGLGFGDVKFFLVAGFFLKFENFPAFLMLSGLFGLLIAMVWKVLKKGELFPFGPALGISLLFCYVFPEIGSISNNIIEKII